MRKVLLGLLASGLLVVAAGSMAVADQPTGNLGRCVSGDLGWVVAPGQDPTGTNWHVGKAVGRYENEYDWTGPMAAMDGLNRSYYAGGQGLQHVMPGLAQCGKEP